MICKERIDGWWPSVSFSSRFNQIHLLIVCSCLQHAWSFDVSSEEACCPGKTNLGTRANDGHWSNALFQLSARIICYRSHTTPIALYTSPRSRTRLLSTTPLAGLYKITRLFFDYIPCFRLFGVPRFQCPLLHFYPWCFSCPNLLCLPYIHCTRERSQFCLDLFFIYYLYF